MKALSMADSTTESTPIMAKAKDNKSPCKLITSGQWTWTTMIRDHTQFLTMLPTYLGADLIPGYWLAPVEKESIMVTMNEVNKCPYCTGLHGELARMAGVDTNNIDQSMPGVMYGTFKVVSTRNVRYNHSWNKRRTNKAIWSFTV